MSSAYTPRFMRILHKIPGLFKMCPEYNYHYFWHRLCFCRLGEHCGGWHGGVYDFKLKVEYQLCKQCAEEKAKKILIEKVQRS